MLLQSNDFHYSEYFPDMPEGDCTIMATRRSEDALPIRLQPNNTNAIEAYFISEWAPPISFYNRLVERFADIRIEYEYHEWQRAFAGFGVAGAALEPTHFSYECNDDINLMRRAHEWHISISNPHFDCA